MSTTVPFQFFLILCCGDIILRTSDTAMLLLNKLWPKPADHIWPYSKSYNKINTNWELADPVSRHKPEVFSVIGLRDL